MGTSVQATTGTLRRTANAVLSGSTNFTILGAVKFPAAAATDPQAFTIEGFNTTATFELFGLGQNDVADGDDVETLIRLPGGTTHIDTLTNAAAATIWLHFAFTWNHTTAAFTCRIIAAGFNAGSPSYLVNSSGTAATPNATTNAINVFNNRFGDGGLNVLLGHLIVTPLELTEAQVLAQFAQRAPTSTVTGGGSYSYLACTSAAAIATDAGTLAANFTASGLFVDSSDQPSEWGTPSAAPLSKPKTLALLDETPFYERPLRRTWIPVGTASADAPPCVMYDTSDEAQLKDEPIRRRPWAPPAGAVQTQQISSRARMRVADDQIEERLARRPWYPGSTDRPIFKPRRAIEETQIEEPVQRRDAYLGSTDRAPLTVRRLFDEPGQQDTLQDRPSIPTGAVQAGDQPPRARARTLADDSAPDGIQRRPWIPVSGPIITPDNAPRGTARAVADDLASDTVQRRPWYPGSTDRAPRATSRLITDEALPDGIQRRAWLPVSGPVVTPDSAPRSTARQVTDESLPDGIQRRPWLPVSGPVLAQAQALLRPRAVLDEPTEDRLQRRLAFPVSSDAAPRRAQRATADEAQQDERLQRRAWAPVGGAPVVPDAPPRLSRARVTDDNAPDGIQRRPWMPSGAPVIRDNPPPRAVRVFADETFPDTIQRKPWIPVAGPVIPHFGGSVRVYYRTQSVRVRIIE